jgi:hypothetical protein
MKIARLRLILASGLFIAWIAWLVYLASTTTRPIVLSRPQFLASDLTVIADIKADGDHPNPAVKVVEVAWAKSKPSPRLDDLTVDNLAGLSQKNGWQGPNRYILPLRQIGSGDSIQYQLVRVPPSPGFPPPPRPSDADDDPVLLRIYLAQAETRQQLADMRAGHWEE